MAEEARAALMSIVLATDCYETIRPVISHLRRQTVRDRLEIVIVAPGGQAAVVNQSELERFAGVQVVEVGSLQALGVMRAAGVRAARAPLVFIGETHTYAHPAWAEALIEAHAGPWSVVAPGFGNANPVGALSWAIFLLDYGEFLHGFPPRETPIVPTHNAAYKRQVLLELGSDLESALTHGDSLCLQLRQRGKRLYFEPAARLDHLNIARLPPWLKERFLGGWLLGGRRAARWSAIRRTMYFCGSPLIPALLLFRLRTAVIHAHRECQLPLGTVPAMLLGATVSALGEMVGYARKVGPAADRRMQEFELHKPQYASR